MDVAVGYMRPIENLLMDYKVWRENQHLLTIAIKCLLIKAFHFLHPTSCYISFDSVPLMFGTDCYCCCRYCVNIYFFYRVFNIVSMNAFFFPLKQAVHSANNNNKNYITIHFPIYSYCRYLMPLASIHLLSTPLPLPLPHIKYPY